MFPVIDHEFRHGFPDAVRPASDNGDLVYKRIRHAFSPFTRTTFIVSTSTFCQTPSTT
jgi:hypothetical protein